MTWINDIEKELECRYGIVPDIANNYKLRYNKYTHRASFVFEPDENDVYNSLHSNWYFPHSRRKASALINYLKTALGDKIKFRHEWYETFVYFNDVYELMSVIPNNYLKNLKKLELMPASVVSATQNFTHDYPVKLVIKNKLPFDKYRYLVYTVTRSKDRRDIGQHNLESIFEAVASYEGIRIPLNFSRFHSRTYNPDTYFYSETLEWLPIIYLIEPRYVKRIEQIQTTKEINNNDTAT